MTNILLTGIGRSGTTLLCALLNELPNAVALAEPIPPSILAHRDRAMAGIDRFIFETRRRALEEGVVPSKSIEGQLTDNFMQSPSVEGGLRASRAVTADLQINKKLTPDFTLYIKHPSSFTALAHDLSRHYPLYALVRHPLAVLASWQTVDIPVHRGRIPAAERLDANLRARLDAIPDRIDRQIALLSWWFGIYGNMSEDRILRYEDLIADPVRQLSRLHGRVGAISHALAPEPPEKRYRDVDLAVLAKLLVPIAPLVARFYPDFEESLAQYIDRSSGGS
jgi:hypothetical protein